MGTSTRGLLSLGNKKLGDAIHVFSIPAAPLCCPGATAICTAACYAKKHRFRFKQVKSHLQWCYEQSLLPTFVERIATEIKAKGVLVLRLHSSGDFPTATYAANWVSVMRRCPKVRFYAYTRSWRIPEIVPALEEMASLRCCRLWYSIDAETGLPDHVPPGVRLAYLQVEQDEQPEAFDLRFVTQKLRRYATAAKLPLLCPHQACRAENCGACRSCFSD